MEMPSSKLRAIERDVLLQKLAYMSRRMTDCVDDEKGTTLDIDPRGTNIKSGRKDVQDRR